MTIPTQSERQQQIHDEIDQLGKPVTSAELEQLRASLIATRNVRVAELQGECGALGHVFSRRQLDLLDWYGHTCCAICGAVKPTEPVQAESAPAASASA